MMGPTELKPKVYEEVVAELEDLLTMARTGEITGITLLAELTGARIRSYHTSRDSVMALGHLARMLAITNTALDGVAVGGRGR